jgi:hypothetical protein
MKKDNISGVSLFQLFMVVLLLFLGTCQLNAQIKVGNNPKTINTNSIFEMESSNKGMLLPRLALTSTTSFAPLSAAIEGMTVYNTATTADVTPGIYYNDGKLWVRVVSDALVADNTTPGQLITISNGAGATLTAMSVAVDTTALKAFINSRITNTLANTTNTITSTVNGVVATAPAVNTVANTFNSATRALTTTVNGVAGAAVTLTNGIDSTTASNGLTLTGKNIALGGVLTGATTVTTSATNTLALAGLQSGAATDSVLVVNPTTGVLARKNVSTLVKEPWYNTVTGVGATSNTDSIYIMGNVGIGTSTPGNKLVVATDVNSEQHVAMFTNFNAGASAQGTIGIGGGSGHWTRLASYSSKFGIRNLSDNTEKFTLDMITGNVGIGTTSPTEKLDVIGNIKFTGALMPNNTAGTTGQILTSAGAGVAPTWTTLSDKSQANNGLSKSGDTIQLGGALTGATTVTTSATNTLALAGLQSGASTDSMLVVNPTTGVIARKAMPAGMIMKRVKLTTATMQTISDPNTPASPTPIIATYEDSTGAVISVNIVSRTANTSFTVNAATAVGSGYLNYAYPSQGIVIATGPQGPAGPNIVTNGLSGTGSSFTSTVNGIVATLTPSNGTIASGSTLGFDASGNLVKGLGNTPDSTTASNGLTLTGKDVRIGGALSAASTITTTATNTLALAGLQSGAASDSVVTVDANGVIRRRNVASISGKILNAVYIDDPAYVNTSFFTNTYTDLISYTYTPVSSNSKILVEYDNQNYWMGGDESGGTDDFNSRIFIDGFVPTTNYWAANYAYLGTSFRSSTLLPIKGVMTNTSTVPKTIKIQIRRVSSDDNVTFSGANGTLIIYEIGN